MPTAVPGTVGGYFGSWQGTVKGSSAAQGPYPAALRAPSAGNTAQPGQHSGGTTLCIPPPPSSALPHAPPHGPPPLTFSLSWPCPSGTSPASSTASTQAARHPISGASGGCGDPRTAARSGSGSPTSARTRPGAGEIAAGPRGRAKLRRGGGAGGRVVNRMCALGRALRSRRGSEVFRVFFFFFPLF